MMLINNKWYVAPIQLNSSFLLPIILILFLLPIIKQVRAKKIKWKKDIIYGLFLIYIWILLYITLFPIPLFGSGAKVYTLGFGKQLFINTKISILSSYMPIQLIGNILLLAPLSFFAAVFSSRFAKLGSIFLLVFCSSLTIESLQLILSFFYLGNRTFDVNDLILNSMGTLVGWAFFKFLNIFFNQEITVIRQ